MATHSIIPAWEIPWRKRQATVQGITKESGHNLATKNNKQLDRQIDTYIQSEIFVAVVQSPNHVQFFMIPWTTACQPYLSFTISQSLPTFMTIELMMPSKHLILCCPLVLLSSVIPSIWVFFNESALCIRWPNYWSFSFSISPSNEYSKLISFKIDWFDLLAIKGTLKSLL